MPGFFVIAMINEAIVQCCLFVSAVSFLLWTPGLLKIADVLIEILFRRVQLVTDIVM